MKAAFGGHKALLDLICVCGKAEWNGRVINRKWLKEMAKGKWVKGMVSALWAMQGTPGRGGKLAFRVPARTFSLLQLLWFTVFV